jgi:lysine decarboxylase
MASLDINAGILKNHGHELMKEWAGHLNYFYKEAEKIEGLEFIGKVPGMDWTKINISMSSLGITGDELEKLLLPYNIFIELYTGDLVMCMTGIGNTREHIETLLSALQEISKSRRIDGSNEIQENKKHDNKSLLAFRRTEIYEIPINKESVPLLEAEGLICASSVIPYPPGIPLVCPGEKFDKETLLYIKTLRDNKEKVIGVNELGEVTVGAE